MTAATANPKIGGLATRMTLMLKSRPKGQWAVQCHHCHHLTFVCECGERIALQDVVDIFHVGRCSTCSKLVDALCPAQLDEQEAMVMQKNHSSRKMAATRSAGGRDAGKTTQH